MENNKEQMLTLNLELLSCRSPSPSHPVFLFEQMIMFQIKALKEGRPWQIVTPQFLETFTQSEFFEQNLLCELYLHDRACMMDTEANPVPHIGDIHLRSFTSFVNNNVRWLSASHTILRNEDNSTSWIHGEPRSPLFLIARHKRNLTFSDKVNQLALFQQKVISTYVDMISWQQDIDLQGSSQRWDLPLYP